MKKVRAFDLVGWHPVQTEYDKEGWLYLVEDVDKAIEELKERIRWDEPNDYGASLIRIIEDVLQKQEEKK